MIKKILKKTILTEIYSWYKLYKFKKKWLKENSHNFTTVNNIFNTSLVEVGRASYGELNIVSFSSLSKLYIGNFVSIAQNVTFMLNSEHYTNHISTYPFKVKYIFAENEEAISKGDIIIEDDVCIGYGVIIMSGIKIGKGAIIGAGSVVTKDVPPYSIVGGVPAKILKYRFNENIREKLAKIDFSKFNTEFISNNIDIFYNVVQNENVDSLIEKLGKIDYEKHE